MLLLVAPSDSRPYHRAYRKHEPHQYQFERRPRRPQLPQPRWHCECGDFKRHLITAIICAGPEDRARLALGFPSLIAAIRSQTANPAGIAYLEGIARSYERPLGQGR